MNKKKANTVVWDTYGIYNNPTTIALKKELNKLSKIQKHQLTLDISIVNSSITKRQTKINILKKELIK